MMNSVNRSSFERAGFGSYKKAALSWMFRHGKIFREHLPVASVKRIFLQYGITEGVLVLDEPDRARCKTTTRIHKAYKRKDKKTGGYVNGRTVVLLLPVTESVTFPVGFKFHMPDPVPTARKKTDEKLRKQGVAKKKRPVSPGRDPEYPTKHSLALKLLNEFRQSHPEISVKCLLADALYGTGDFSDDACRILGARRAISQLRSDQNVHYRGKTWNPSDFFNTICKGTTRKVSVRGGSEVKMTVSGARLHVDIACLTAEKENYRTIER